MDELSLNISLVLLEIHRVIINHEASQVLDRAKALEERNNRDFGFARHFVDLVEHKVPPEEIESALLHVAILGTGKQSAFEGLETEARWAMLGKCLVAEKFGQKVTELSRKIHPNMNKRGKTKQLSEQKAFRRSVVLNVFYRNAFFSDFSKEAIFHLFWDGKIKLDDVAEESKLAVMDWADLFDKSANKDIIAFGKKVSRDTTQHEGAASLFIDHFS